MREKLEELRKAIESGELTLPDEIKLISECIEESEKLEAEVNFMRASADCLRKENEELNRKMNIARLLFQ